MKNKDWHIKIKRAKKKNLETQIKNRKKLNK